MTPPTLPALFLPHAALACAMLVWSSSFVALKVGLAGFTPLEVMGLRMSVAALVFAPVLPGLWRTARRHGLWGWLVLMAFCEPCLYFLCEIHALRYTSAAQAGMVVAMLPLTVAVAAWVFLGERVNWRVWLGFGLALGGVLWLSHGAIRTENAPNPWLGNALEAAAMCCATGYTVLMKRLSARYTPLQLTAVQCLVGMAFFAPLAALPLEASTLPLPLELPRWAPLAAVVYLGVFVTMGGYGLYSYGVSRLTASQGAAYTNLIPVLTLGMGVFWLHEAFSPAQYAASALVVAGVVLSQKAQGAA